MLKILIDTMHIYDLLLSKDESYAKFSQALDDEKIIGVISVTTLAEMLILLGKDIYKQKLNELLSLNLEIIGTDQTTAIRAGEIHMIYKLPLGDSLIAATGMTENIKHVLTDDAHFDAIQNIIKPINLKTALKMCR
jgi:predicted nucleic acid-binding protein